MKSLLMLFGYSAYHAECVAPMGFRNLCHCYWRGRMERVVELMFRNVKSLRFIGTDDFHREVFIDKFGTVWKYTEPGKMPQERHDKLYTSSSNSMDGEPEEPMAEDLAYKI